LLPLVQQLEATWNSRFANLPFDLIFLEDHLNQLYIKDQVFARLFQLLTMLTILIACFGLYALISLITSQKTKEISVRKVLGADLKSLLLQLFKPFAWYILIAAVIVSPIVYIMLSTWLDNYAYTIELSWIWFVASALLILTVAFVATVSHSHKISGINPAKTLKSE
jgi:putative ABC transport system permease protein